MCMIPLVEAPGVELTTDCEEDKVVCLSSRSAIMIKNRQYDQQHCTTTKTCSSQSYILKVKGYLEHK